MTESFCPVASTLSRRTTLDVIADILRAASTPTSRNKILFAANLNHAQVVKYVGMLVDCGMLRPVTEKGSTTKFVATETGLAFLSRISAKFGSILPDESAVWAVESLPLSSAGATRQGEKLVEPVLGQLAGFREISRNPDSQG